MVSQVRSAVNAPALCAMDTKARQTFNSSGVHTITYVPYLVCSLNLYKLSQQSIAGESFALGAEVRLDKWTNRGLDPTVLARIHTEVFDASAPTS